jgi:general secretion pathway protein F
VPVYAYKGVTAAGRKTKGHLDAESPRSARARLRRDGVFITELEEGRRSDVARSPASTGRFAVSLPSFQRVSGLDLALMTRQLSTLIGAGIPLVSALRALTDQVENAKLKGVLGNVRDRVNEGAALADAMAAGGGVFPDLYIGMVRAGEAGGALETVLERLADYLESQVRLRNKVSSILIYPTVMFLFACVVVGALVTVVLPQITELLASLNQPLPFYTRWIIALSHFTRDFWWVLVLAGIGAVVAFRGAIRTERGRATYDRVRLRLPVVGRLVRLLAISRFARTLSTLLSGGLPITRALETAAEVAGNTVIAAAIGAARTSITEGASVAAPLKASGEFPPMVTHMIEVGEQSGELELMLTKVSDTYEEQVETTVTRLTALLEPILILVMVGIVLVIILATLVPLLQITTSLG